MRDFKHILNLIKVSAQFHLAQRPILVRKIKVEIAEENQTVQNEWKTQRHVKPASENLTESLGETRS
jgi:hypothetical protein